MRAALATFAVVLAASAALAEEPRKTSPEEREQIVELSKAYLRDVMAPESKSLALNVVEWWSGVSDLRVPWCKELLPDEARLSQDLRFKLNVAVVAASGIFVVQNPERATDARAAYVEGLEGVVRAYQQVLSKDAGARNEFMDRVCALQAAGKLGEYVDTHTAGCRQK